jgi:hypothetical protein
MKNPISPNPDVRTKAITRSMDVPNAFRIPSSSSNIFAVRYRGSAMNMIRRAIIRINNRTPIPHIS